MVFCNIKGMLLEDETIYFTQYSVDMPQRFYKLYIS